MGLPGHRRTSSDKRRRAAHFALAKPNVSTCPNCKAKRMPHRVCPKCGTYKGRTIIVVKTKSSRAAKKAKSK